MRTLWVLAAVALMAPVGQLSAVASTVPVSVTAKAYPISEEAFPGPVVADPHRHLVYAGLSQTGELAALDTSNRQVLELLLEGVASATVLDRRTGRLYVVEDRNSFRSGKARGFIEVFHGMKHVATVRLAADASPAGAVLDARRRLLYVVESGIGRVAVLRGTKVEHVLKVGKGPTQIAENTKTGDLFVSDTAGRRVTVIHGGKVVREIPVPEGPAGLAVDTRTGTTYVTCGSSAKIAVLKGRHSRTVITLPEYSNPTSVAVDDTDDVAWVAETGTYNGDIAEDDGDHGDDDGDSIGAGWAVLHGRHLVASHELDDDSFAVSATYLPGSTDALISVQGSSRSVLVDPQAKVAATMPYSGGGAADAVSDSRIWTSDGGEAFERVTISGQAPNTARGDW